MKLFFTAFTVFFLGSWFSQVLGQERFNRIYWHYSSEPTVLTLDSIGYVTFGIDAS